MICYDKAFPEAARTLALDGAEIIVCVSAWPAARTASAADLAEDRWTKRFSLFDQARALENQVVWVASNQAGTFGRCASSATRRSSLRAARCSPTPASAPGWRSRRSTSRQELAAARRAMFHLRDRRPDAYMLERAYGEEALVDA